jgi:uncharacterized protein (DUF1501 family)
MGVFTMLTRRSLLKYSAMLSLAPTVPGFLSRTAMTAEPETDGRTLVVVQLDGGNDGIKTGVPFGDEDYARHCRPLRIPADRVCKLTDRVGLHPAMRPPADMIQDGRLAIVQAVGFPDPDRKLFRSMAIVAADEGGDAIESFPGLEEARPSAGMAGIILRLGRPLRSAADWRPTT